jgi:Flp pilus assembly protein TadD
VPPAPAVPGATANRPHAERASPQREETEGEAETSDSERAQSLESEHALPMARAGRAIRLGLGLSLALIVAALVYRMLFPAEAGVRTREPAADPSEAQTAEPATADEPEPPTAPTANALPATATAPEPSGPATGTEPAAAAADETATVPGSVDELLAQAKTLEQQGKPKKAVELYERAAALDPNSAPVLSRLAFGYLNRGDNQQAADYAARAVAVDPTSSEGWIVLGAARDALGDAKGARDAYRKCVELGTGEYLQECRRVAR